MKNTLFATILLGAAITAGCGDDNTVKPGEQLECGAGTMQQGNECVSTSTGNTCGAGTMMVGNECLPTPVTPPDKVFVQVEQLARPGINEALLLSDGFLTGYNATAPTFAGVPGPVLNDVVAEAKTVLKAVYLGVCFVNGAAGLTAQTGLHPAGMECHAVGPAVFESDGVTQTAASITASQAYADAVFGLFIPDVMRIDTSITSTYLALCGGTNQLLCGGRFPSDDVIDVTYDFLLNGAATCGAGFCGAPNQFNALVSDGVAFDRTDTNQEHLSRINGDPNNPNQGHPAISNSFPYSAAPF